MVKDKESFLSIIKKQIKEHNLKELKLNKEELSSIFEPFIKQDFYEVDDFILNDYIYMEKRNDGKLLAIRNKYIDISNLRGIYGYIYITSQKEFERVVEVIDSLIKTIRK